MRPRLVLPCICIDTNERAACAGELRPGSYPGNPVLVGCKTGKPGRTAGKVFNGAAECIGAIRSQDLVIGCSPYITGKTGIPDDPVSPAGEILVYPLMAGFIIKPESAVFTQVP